MYQRWFLSLVVIGLSASSASAATIGLSGFLNDAGNPFLVGPLQSPDPPLFGDDFEIANNTALHPITITVAGTVTFTSLGFAAGGVDPYFTLFSGTGPGAVFVDSNFVQAFSTGGDFSLSFDLAAGDYTVAMGAFANMSFAENLGAGTLGDGFTALGGPSFLGTYYYELEILTPDSQVAEPSSLTLIALAGAAAIGSRRRKKTWLIH
jgi:hypothetical protein